MSTSDTSKVTCAACGRAYQWKPEFAGKNVRCKCNEKFEMPLEDPAAMQSEDADLALDINLLGDEKPAATVAAKLDTVKATSTCPSCGNAVNPAAVICVGCGFNLQEGKQLTTEQGGVVVPRPGRGTPRRNIRTSSQGGFFDRISRGWHLAKISYEILWDFKQLIVFPIFSAIATILVIASFILPLWGTGTLDSWKNAHDHGTQVSPVAYVVTFAFYFCCYFVIVFFNTALTACAMKVTAGEAPTIGYGLSIAVKRLPQIAAWAFVSAIVGLLLKIIENSHKKAGAIISAILGSGWTILTFFVVPVLCVEGVGPVEAVKRSFGTLRDAWGEGLVGNSSMGLMAFLVTLPVYILIAVGLFAAAAIHSPALAIGLIAFGVLFIIFHAAASSAADGIFKALLYNFATGRSMPADIDEDVFASAFASKG